ncbi:MAG: hypothetical protein FWG39_04220, partial [Alphaproteobacteria bacterium]|nr:hypothetical protein [Alphaproteobacteria bacterium]
MRKLIYVLCFMPCALYGQTADFFAPRAVALEPAPDECVGKTDNMACVFDTVIACAVRRDAKLCEKVGLKYDRQFKNTFGVLAGGDYKYNLVELFINRRGGACSVDDARSCVTN